MTELEKKAYAYVTDRQKDPNYPTYNWETEICDAYEQGYKDAIEKACEWLNENMEDYTEWFDVDEDYCQHYAVSSNYDYKKDFIRALRKAMEEQQ